MSWKRSPDRPPLETPPTAGELQARKKEERNRFFLTPLGIIILTLTVAGPFTIPLVWKSPHMSRPVKWVFTIAIALFSLAVLWALWMIVMFTIRVMTDLDSAMNL